MTIDDNRPRRRALLCGISTYSRPYGALPAVLNELRDLESVLSSELHQDFRYDEVKVYKDEELTITGIEQLLAELTVASHLDELLVYFAGIGTVHNTRGYFVTYNAPLSPPGMRMYELAALLTKLPCKRIFVVLDFCYAGKLIEEDKTLFESLSESQQIAILAACRSNEVAASRKDARSFTRELVDALRQDRGDENGIVRWSHIATRVCAALERSPLQRPIDRLDYLRHHPINHVEPHQPPATLSRLGAKRDHVPNERILYQYLDEVIKRFTLLDLRGLSGTQQNIDIPLDHVYVDLQAEPDNPTERDYDRRLLELDVREYLAARGLDATDEAVHEEAVQRVLSREAYALRLAQTGRRNSQGHPLPKGNDVLQLAEVVRRERRAIVLGDPGCGKTTLLRYCALHFAKAMLDSQTRVSISNDVRGNITIEDLGPTRLPIFMRIAAYAEARKHDPNLRILEFLPRYWISEQSQIHENELYGLFRHHLDTGCVLLLFDGLDEIAKLHERREVVRHVEQFVESNVPFITGIIREDFRGQPVFGKLPPVKVGGNQVLITSRVAGYRAVPFRESLTHYTVQDLSDVAIDAFLRRWCLAIEERQGEERSHADHLARAERQRRDLLDAITLPQLRRLAVNPLLLTLLALLNRSQGRLPRLRIEVYRNVTRTLVETWRESTLTEDEVLDVLGPVALRIHEEIHTGLATSTQLDEYLSEALAAWRGLDPSGLPGSFKQEVHEFLETIRRESGLLLARGEGLFGFAHLTFQEYFVARQITRKPADAADYITSRLIEPRWREPLLLAIAQVAKEARGELPALLQAALRADVAHDDLLHHRLLFVASVFPECAWIPKALAQTVCGDLFDAYLKSHRSGRLIALQRRIEIAYSALRGSQPHEPAEESLLGALMSDDELKRAAAAQLIERSEWFSRPALECILHRIEITPEPTLLALLDVFEQRAMALYDERLSPLRYAAARRFHAWRQLLAEPAIRDLVLLVYTSTAADSIDDAAICEHLGWGWGLTPLFVAALDTEAPVEALHDHCQIYWRSKSELAGWAGLVLRWLGVPLPERGERESCLLLNRALELTVARSRRWQSAFDAAPIALVVERLLDERPSLGLLTHYLHLITDVSLHPWILNSVIAPENVPRSALDASPRVCDGPRHEIKDAVLCGVVRLRLVRQLESVSAPAVPTARIPRFLPQPHINAARVRELVQDLYSNDDSERESAAMLLERERRLSEIGAEVIHELDFLNEALDDSTHPRRGFVGTILATALNKIQYDCLDTVTQWLDEERQDSSEADAVRRYLSYCTDPSDAVASLLLEAIPERPELRKAVLHSFSMCILDNPAPTRRLWIEAALGHILPAELRKHSEDLALPSASLEYEELDALDAIVGMKYLASTLVIKLAEVSRSTTYINTTLAAGLGVAAGLTSIRAIEINTLLKCDRLLAAIATAANEATTINELVSATHEHLPARVDDYMEPIVMLAAKCAGSLPDTVTLLHNWANGDVEFLDSTALNELARSSHSLLVDLANSESPHTTNVGRLGLLMFEAYSYVGDGELDDPSEWPERMMIEWASQSPEIDINIVLTALAPGYHWSSAKDRLASLGARLIEKTPSMMPVLRNALAHASTWRAREAIYGQLSKLAMHDSSFLNREYYPELGTDLMLGCQDPESWTIREFAIAVLGRLRHLDRDVGAVLLHLCKDIPVVQQATLSAARSFQSFDAGVLEDLAPALADPSARTAITVAALLATLGTGGWAKKDLRRSITDALASACHHPSASRTVDDKAVSEYFYEALLEVTA